MVGVLSAVKELLPAPPQPNAFDANLFFERRTASLARARWNARGSWCVPRHELLALLRMYTFWLIVWGCKICFSGMVLLPVLFTAHVAFYDAFPSAQLLESGAISLNGLWAQPAFIVRSALVIQLWWDGEGGLCLDGL